MTDDISKAIAINALLFEEQLEPQLKREWGGELVSIEAQSASALAEIFDKGASSDIVLSYLKTKGPTLTVASRMAFDVQKPSEPSKFTKYNLDFTFRCSYPDGNGNVSFDCELAKLIRSFEYLKDGIPVVVPFYYVKARFIEEADGRYRLFDFAIAETRRLIETIVSPSFLNWNELKQRITPDLIRSPKPISNSKGTGVLINKADQKGFVFLDLPYLESSGVPFSYRWFSGEQSRLDGSLFRNDSES